MEKKMRVGVIGFGARIDYVMQPMKALGLPVEIVAVADPRAEEIKAKKNPLLEKAVFFKTADEMLAKGGFDGIMIGTRCNLHVEMARKVASLDLPLFLEKPLAITYDQVRELEAAFAGYKAPVVVSFPLRVSTVMQKVKEIVDSGILGSIEHVVAFNDVPYGGVYFWNWYRDFKETGGLFLQKATHDLDYISYVLGQKAKWVCAMKSQRVLGPSQGVHAPMPMDLLCKDCGERETCPEGPFNLFYKRMQGEGVVYDDQRRCLFGKDIKNEDSGNCLIEFENGVQATYTQNFFARHKAERRGARFYGYKGTLEFDWYKNEIKVFRHDAPVADTIQVGIEGGHFGGDRELCMDFYLAMRDRRPSRSPLSAGIQSALLCLCARESAETRAFCEVKVPAKAAGAVA